MKKIKLKKNMVNFLLTVLAFMATAGVNNYSISGLYQPKKPDDLKWTEKVGQLRRFTFYYG